MSGRLSIIVYGRNLGEADRTNELIQEVMAEGGVRGSVTLCFVNLSLAEAGAVPMPPAVEIDGETIFQGRPPTRAELEAWFDEHVPPDDRVPRRPVRRGWPSSVPEAVDWIVEEMDDDDKVALASASDEDLIMYHMSMGMGIRNVFGLWAGNSALLADCGTTEADEASSVIIRAVRDRLRRERGPHP